MCRIVSIAVYDVGAFGAARAVTHCVEHHMLVTPQMGVGRGDEVMMCPIGKIERARDEALAAIDAKFKGVV